MLVFRPRPECETSLLCKAQRERLLLHLDSVYQDDVGDWAQKIKEEIIWS